MKLTIQTEQEADGRWIAEVPEMPGTMAYGATRERAIAGVEDLALRVLAASSDAECSAMEAGALVTRRQGGEAR